MVLYVAFRKKQYEGIEALQIDLDKFMDWYNYKRTHQGYKLKENGYRMPAEAHLSKDLTLRKESSKKNQNQSRPKRRWRKILIVAYDFVKIDRIKEEVLETQLVTTS